MFELPSRDSSAKPDYGARVGMAFQGPRPESASPVAAAASAPALLCGLVAADALVVVGTGLAAEGIAARLLRAAPADPALFTDAVHGFAGVFNAAVGPLAVLSLMCFYSAGCYRNLRPKAVRRTIGSHAGPLFGAWTAAFLVLVLMLGVTGDLRRLDTAAAGTLWLWYGLGLFGLTALRSLFLRLARDWNLAGGLRQRTLLVGTNDLALEWLDRLQRTEGAAYQVVGAVSTAADRPSSVNAPPLATARLAGVPVLGSVAGLVEQVRKNRIDLVVVALPWSAEAEITDILERLRVLAVDVRLLPHRLIARTAGLSVDATAGVPLLGVIHHPLAGWRGVLKRSEDLLIGGAALAALAPLLLLAAAAIKLESPGPVLFRQKRFGFNNEEFEIWKFRTMHTDRGDQSGAQRTVRNDPRVTRVGRFLRRTSIDELPQLFNVLRGDMSIVGPRPHPVAMKAGDVLYHEAVENYACRHRVRPGITGWAQVNGLRGEIDNLHTAARRVEHDLYYVDNWSLGLDAEIMVRTALLLFWDRNAY
ncbi:undecaprenyl-phosphate glucose phosphotransferase [Azospirillum brasilense]|uniref:Undecaprenyl-phosphate glucose phosphotransferase n=1 Tax=Azospirillum brasilense TaxID=192 RepID=A0A6L3AUL1_AZOBR|nr:undecaprenyl-phosphate glucose phosphotransferase [Azospirillum brasilense]KAA0679874.1 undecaprenyl-phosphate glucose phosphotransferase [Azospirillum brasilense]